MQVVRTRIELQKLLAERRSANPAVRQALIPTMGFLHDGHLSLFREARTYADFCSVSIFVNPIQFNNPEDLAKYPSNLERDLDYCEREGMEIVFAPSREEMYPQGIPVLQLSAPALSENLCASRRPGHFEGVLLIVARLFHLFAPQTAVFGKKDYQQYILIRRMVEDLDMAVKVEGSPTVRESDGLAMSSRNARLDSASREHAALIHRALRLGEKTYREGNRSAVEIQEIVSDVIESGSRNKTEYVEIVDCDSLKKIEALPEKGKFLIAAAVFCGGVRLIDNIEVSL